MKGHQHHQDSWLLRSQGVHIGARNLVPMMFLLCTKRFVFYPHRSLFPIHVWTCQTNCIPLYLFFNIFVWVFPKIVLPPLLMNVIRVFHHKPGSPIFGSTQIHNIKSYVYMCHIYTVEQDSWGWISLALSEFTKPNLPGSLQVEVRERYLRSLRNSEASREGAPRPGRCWVKLESGDSFRGIGRWEGSVFFGVASGVKIR